MNIQILQDQVLVNEDGKNIQEMTKSQYENYMHNFQQTHRRSFADPRKYKELPEIKKDNSIYEFKAFHKVQNMSSAHFQSKYTLCMGELPNILMHTYYQSIIFYDIAKRKSYSTPINVESIGLDVSGKYCAVAGMSGDVLLCNLHNGKMEKHKLNTRSHFINHVQFYNEYLIINDNECHIKIYDYENGMKNVLTYKDKASVNLTTVNNNHQVAFCGDRLGLSVLDAQTGDIIHELLPHTEYGFAVAFNPCKQYELGSSSEDGSVVIYDLRAPKQPLQQFVGTGLPIYNITYSKTGSHLFIAESSNNLHIFDAQSYGSVQSIEFCGEVSGIANDPYDINTFYFSLSHRSSRDGICQFSKQ